MQYLTLLNSVPSSQSFELRAFLSSASLFPASNSRRMLDAFLSPHLEGSPPAAFLASGKRAMDEGVETPRLVVRPPPLGLEGGGAPAKDAGKEPSGCMVETEGLTLVDSTSKGHNKALLQTQFQTDGTTSPLITTV